MPIDVTRDSVGLKQALGELLEESYAFSRVRRTLDRSSDESRERQIARLPGRSLSPGYYKLAEYIFWLEERIKAGIRFDRLDAFEMEGLTMLLRARGDFEYNHPTCACGAHQDSRFELQCHACGIEFQKRSVA